MPAYSKKTTISVSGWSESLRLSSTDRNSVTFWGHVNTIMSALIPELNNKCSLVSAYANIIQVIFLKCILE